MEQNPFGYMIVIKSFHFTEKNEKSPVAKGLSTKAISVKRPDLLLTASANGKESSFHCLFQRL